MDRENLEKFILDLRGIAKTVLMKNEDGVFKPIKNTSRQDAFKALFEICNMLKSDTCIEDDDFIKNLLGKD